MLLNIQGCWTTNLFAEKQIRHEWRQNSMEASRPPLGQRSAEPVKASGDPGSRPSPLASPGFTRDSVSPLHASLPSCIMRGLENKTVSSQEISGYDCLWFKLVVNWDPFVASKDSLTITWRTFRPHPQPIPATSAHQLTQQTTILKFLFRIQQLCRADFKSTKRSSVSSVSQVTLTSLFRVATHTPRRLKPWNQEPLPQPVQAAAP